MIQKDGNQLQIVCDECGNEYPEVFDKEDFQEMINAAKRSDWKVTPDGEGGWSHVCCEPKSRLERAKALFGK